MSCCTTPSETLTIPERVICAVAEAKGAKPLELSEPLANSIDPDALETLVERGSDAGVRVSFTYLGCAVTVDGTGEVSASVVGADSDRSPAVVDREADLDDSAFAL